MRAMAIHVFQHSDSVNGAGGAGRLGMTLRDHGFLLDIRRPDQGDGVPVTLDGVEGIIILGGAMNVTDIGRLPWMQAEAELIKKAHEAKRPIIGICLGHQLIAHALGGQVGLRETPELGFSKLLLNTSGQTETILAGIPWETPQFYTCEQEVKTLPAGAVLLGSTKGTKNSVFRVGVRTYGFQQHFEADRAMVEQFIEWGAKGGMSSGDARAQLERDYPSFARASDRLCVNLATYCFPLERRLK